MALAPQHQRTSSCTKSAGLDPFCRHDIEFPCRLQASERLSCGAVPAIFVTLEEEPAAGPSLTLLLSSHMAHGKLVLMMQVQGSSQVHGVKADLQVKSTVSSLLCTAVKSMMSSLCCPVSGHTVQAKSTLWCHVYGVKSTQCHVYGVWSKLQTSLRCAKYKVVVKPSLPMVSAKSSIVLQRRPMRFSDPRGKTGRALAWRGEGEPC